VEAEHSEGNTHFNVSEETNEIQKKNISVSTHTEPLETLEPHGGKRTHHCCFSDGPKTVDKNVAGYVHRRTWREEKRGKRERKEREKRVEERDMREEREGKERGKREKRGKGE